MYSFILIFDWYDDRSFKTVLEISQEAIAFILASLLGFRNEGDTHGID